MDEEPIYTNFETAKLSNDRFPKSSRKTSNDGESSNSDGSNGQDRDNEQGGVAIPLHCPVLETCYPYS